MSQCRSFRWKFLCVSAMKFWNSGHRLPALWQTSSSFNSSSNAFNSASSSWLTAGGWRRLRRRSLGKYGFSYCHHKAFMNLRNHLHVFFSGGETLKLKQKYSVPKNCASYLRDVQGMCSWVHVLILELRNAYLWPVWNPRRKIFWKIPNNGAKTEKKQNSSPFQIQTSNRNPPLQTKKKYFTSSDPHHDMLGGGCQVRVVI